MDRHVVIVDRDAARRGLLRAALGLYRAEVREIDDPASLQCAVSTNVRIMEIDIDDVPWKDDLLTEALDIRDGHLWLPSRPGWGADLNEREIARHPWPH